MHGVDDVRAALQRAEPLCPAGCRHAGGGQQMLDGGWILDMTGMRRVRSVDRERGEVEVEAGADWVDVLAFLRREAPEWTIRQKQSVSRVTLGGSVSANAHGNGLGMGPMISDVVELELVDPSGTLRRCSHDRDPEWLAMAVGGYGMVGVITAVRLRLQRRRKMRLLADVVEAADVPAAFGRRIAEGAAYATCELETGLRHGLLMYQVPDEDGAPEAGFRADPEAFVRLARLLHRDRAAAWREMCAAWLASAGRTYWVDDLLTSEAYVAGYHERIGPGADPIVELLVPVDALPELLRSLRERLRDEQVLLCSVRLLEADGETVLAYARERCACVALMIHVDGSAKRLIECLRGCLDDVLALGGRLHPTFARIATSSQWLRAFPRWPEFVRRKCGMDPESRFHSAWFDAYARPEA